MAVYQSDLELWLETQSCPLRHIPQEACEGYELVEEMFVQTVLYWAIDTVGQFQVYIHAYRKA
jgi:hypothetical protein